MNLTPRVEGEPRIAFEDRGQGNGVPPLLLFTGWCSSRQRWSETLPLLALHHRVVSFEWRGHGESDPAGGDFGKEEMLADALAVIEAAGLESFVPCAASHSGWIAIELRRRFPDRVPALVHFDWMVSEPPEPYTRVIERLTAPEEWSLARDTLFEIWRAGVKTEEIDEAFDVMAAQGREMWMRSGREIGSEYRRDGSPLAAWSRLEPRPPVLHVFGQPAAPEYLASQQEFAAGHPWFHVRRVPALSHFTMLETASEADAAVFDFLTTCGL